MVLASRAVRGWALAWWISCLGATASAQTPQSPGADGGPTGAYGPSAWPGGATGAGPGTGMTPGGAGATAPESGMGAAAPSGSAPAAPGTVDAALSSGLGGGLSANQGGYFPNMLGDHSPLTGVRLDRIASRLARRGNLTAAQQQGRKRFVGATAGGFKIADNQSPLPQDRVFAGVYYYDDLFASINRRLGSSIHDERIVRQVYGFEKTLFGPNLSIGFQQPVNTLSLKDPNFGGSSTAFGDLSVFIKGILWQDPAGMGFLSAGLAVTPPSGPSHFAGFKVAGDVNRPIRDTDIQPFLGYFKAWDRLFLQGFLAVSVPTDTRDVTLLYNDVGIGYYVYRSEDLDRVLTAVIPTLEVHVNNPLNHRGTSPVDPIGAKDVVDLTYGVNWELFGTAYLSTGLATPVTGPRPFDVEAIALLNIRFGRSRARRLPPPTL